MEQPVALSEPVPKWQKTATSVVYALAVAVVLYLGYAYYTQRMFAGLMTELLSGDRTSSDAAAARLVATDESLPYLADALLNDPRPQARALAAKTIRRRVQAKINTIGLKPRLSLPLDLEAVTRALSDESPEVRAAALTVVNLVGCTENYQRNRLDEMRQFEGLLKDLGAADASAQAAAAEGFRAAGDRALPFLVGVVSSEDKEQRLRGLTTLRACVQEILRSSNQRRIVPLLERRRCRLLLREMTRLDPSEQALVTDVLNVSGRLPESLFADFLKAWPTLDAAGRERLLEERVEFLEVNERLRGGAEPEVEKMQQLHDKTGAK